MVRSGPSQSAASCAGFARVSVLFTRDSFEASNACNPDQCPSTTLDELRWVGLDECDLPVLSVFKDLHPRVCWFVFLATSRRSDRLVFTWHQSGFGFATLLSDVFGRRPRPQLNGTGGSMIVPSDSSARDRHDTPSRTCATPVEPGDPIDLDRKRSMCGRWRYSPLSLHAPTESSRFLVELVCNERSSRALPQAVPRLSPMGRSTQPNGSSSPRSTSLRAFARSLHRPRTKRSSAHSALPFGSPLARSRPSSLSRVENAKAPARPPRL